LRDTNIPVELGKLIASWPALRQAAGDPLGLGKGVRSQKTRELRPRIGKADHVVHSICPYCAVGCGQLIYVKDGEVTQIEGDPKSPISRGRLCPKGAASKQLVTSDLRQYRVKYRRPYSLDWESLPLEDALDMIADRVIKARGETWEDTDAEGRTLNRTLGIASLGGATIDNEENYLIKKLFTALGVVSVENQARI
jgi:formate dehydrogenase major subunit